MTFYGTNSSERTWVPVTLGLVAIAIAWIFALLLDIVHIQIPWYLESPSPILFLGLLLAAFDHRLWRIDVLRRAGLIRVPDLQGRWIGEATSTTGHKIPVELLIFQTWRTISIRLTSGNSISRSTVAAMFVGDPGGPTLAYQYANQPTALAGHELHAHIGTATLTLVDSQLTGEYYNGRDRNTQGTLTLARNSARQT